ncbi:class I SAM-dependent methyltransferase [Desulfococcaceae bacterium HSG7]|nr:class I SAM-dependent methyltransferase [Desulfococcaceae bacterium HSG7]
MTNDNWRLWEKRKEYGDMLYKRAIGDLDEMESSKAICHVLSDYYKTGMKLLDAGCGPAHYLRSLRKRLDKNIYYTGVDATEYYISLAKKAFPDSSRFHVGEIFNLPFNDSEYDIVINNNVLLHLPPPPTKAIEELIRVSKKYIIIRTTFGESNYIIKQIWSENEGAASQHYAKDLISSDYDLKAFHYYNMYTEKYLTDIIRNISPEIHIEMVKDDMWTAFDNTSDTDVPATKSVNEKQIAGNLLLDWKFIILTKE